MQICDPISANCYVCFPLEIPFDESMNIEADLTPASTPYLWLTDKFGNQYRIQLTIAVDGSFDIDIDDFPEGMFLSSGVFDLFVSSDINGLYVLEIFGFTCVILSINC